MRYFTLFFALALFLLTGCDKSKEAPTFEAAYKGTFTRTDNSSTHNPMVANVTLNFTERTFTGTSDVRNYPAICNGAFDISQSTLTVNNSCYFTADFDGTLIFNGKYTYELAGDQLRIMREYANGQKDIYQLTKEK